MSLSDARADRRLKRRRGSRPLTRHGPPTLPRQPSPHAAPITPVDGDRCLRWLLPCARWPSPVIRRVGVRDCTFEACSGFTRVAACGFAGPHPAGVPGASAAGSDRAPPGWLPSQTINCSGGTLIHWLPAPSWHTDGLRPFWLPPAFLPLLTHPWWITN